jgi:hypothetical protein
MHEHQQNQRITAARAFMESLDQLQDMLVQERQMAKSESQPSGDRVSQVEPSSSALVRNTDSCSENGTDLKILEEAAADLDEFFGDSQSLEEWELGEEI